jgi:predicted RNA binding protein YcfA (HicA-like mRNA interferase family)
MLRALQRAGFREDRRRGSHLTLIQPSSGRHTTLSMHGGTLKTGITHGILNQAGLSVEEFIELLK